MINSAKKAELRRKFRNARRKLDSTRQHANAQALQHNFLTTCLMLRYQRFAIYLPADGEIDTAPIVSKLLEGSKDIALPCLRKSHFDNAANKTSWQMHFGTFSQSTPLVRGAYNLLEPAAAERPSRFSADVILLPTVAYDRSGNRLGMGGGFYDRHLQHPSNRNSLRIGLAHSAQEISQPLPTEAWDMKLDALINEREVLTFNTRASTLIARRPCQN